MTTVEGTEAVSVDDVTSACRIMDIFDCGGADRVQDKEFWVGVVVVLLLLLLFGKAEEGDDGDFIIKSQKRSVVVVVDDDDVLRGVSILLWGRRMKYSCPAIRNENEGEKYILDCFPFCR